MARRDIQAIFNQASIDMSRAGALLVSRRDTLKLMGDPLHGSAYDRDGSTRGGISDPTPSAAFALAPWHDLDRGIDEDVELLAATASRLVQRLNRVPNDIDTIAISRQHRCSGGQPSTEEWTRRECQNLAVTRDGLCSPCYQRKHHHQAKQQVA